MVATRNPNLGPSLIRAKRRRLFFIRLLIIFFLLLIIIFSLAFYSDHDKISIKKINILDNASVSAEEISELAKRDLTGRYWYLFSKSNYLIFPRFQIKEDILNEFKIIKDVDVSWADWQNIDIRIVERKPHSLWCGNEMMTDSSCYFVDKDGYVYIQSPVFSGSMFIKNYGNISAENPIDQYFLSTDNYKQIYNLVDILDQNSLKVKIIFYDGQNFKFTLDSGPTIIFNSKKGFDIPFSNLLSALNAKTLDLINEAKSINYVDLRFDNKIVVGKNEQ